MSCYGLLFLPFLIVGGNACSSPSYQKKAFDKIPVSTSAEPGEVMHWLKDVNRMSSSDIEILKRYILRHGAVVIKGQNLTHEQQINLTKALGTPVDIPNTFYSHGDGTTKNITVVPVSNYRHNGTWRGRRHAYGQYWHKDVNFFQHHRAYVLSILYAKEYKQGGDGGKTGFIDGCKARRELPAKLEKIVRNIRFKFGTKLIDDFRHAPESHLDYFPEVERNVIFEHPERKCECLNLAKSKSGFMFDNSTDEGLSGLEETWNWLQNRSLYIHTWSEGDLVIWDNFAVFHRLLPYIDAGEKRAFYRTYSRVKLF